MDKTPVVTAERKKNKQRSITCFSFNISSRISLLLIGFGAKVGTARSQNCGISVFEMLGRFGLGGQVWPYMHNSNQKSSNCNKEVAPKTCHFKQTICRLQKILIFTQLFPFSSLNLWFTHVLSRKCRKWHLRALVGSFSLKSRMVGRLDNSGAGG